MENQVEVLETSDVSNEEIDRILADFELSGEVTSQTSEVEEIIDRSEENRNEEETISQSIEPIIPVNSPTLLVEESSSRFSSAVWYNAVRTKSIVLAGVGGIGRFGNLINFYHLCA